MTQLCDGCDSVVRTRVAGCRVGRLFSKTHSIPETPDAFCYKHPTGQRQGVSRYAGVLILLPFTAAAAQAALLAPSLMDPDTWQWPMGPAGNWVLTKQLHLFSHFDYSSCSAAASCTSRISPCRHMQLSVRELTCSGRGLCSSANKGTHSVTQCG